MIVTRLLRALLALLVGTSLLTGCAQDRVEDEPQKPAAPASGEPGTSGVTPEPAASRAWLDAELTDVSSGEKFRISDFKGRPVLLHAFAVW